MFIDPIQAIDFYKSGHIYQYPKGTSKIYSNFTPRSSKLAAKSSVFEDKVVFFGLQGFIEWFLQDCFNENFFDQKLPMVLQDYQRRMDRALGPKQIGTQHIEALWKLKYLPLRIKALPEGSYVPIRTPLLTITNTNPEFFWLVNYLESVLSAELWKPCTSATTAFQYRRLIQKYAKETGAPLDFVPWQGHDFSFRGSSGIHDALSSGAGHLLSFFGTDTVPSLDYIENYYGGGDPVIAGSVPATEHSVMCVDGQAGEFETFKRLITDVYPAGIISIVSDTWNFWKVLDEVAPSLKTEIMNRNGKVVFRPDSGDPVKIICGDPESDCPMVRAGAVETLWKHFGGTVNAAGFRALDSHVGLIYGDSISLDRCERILEGLKGKGFSSGNIVFGIGSYTYQYVTRDTYGFAMKATYAEVNDKPVEMFKDPVTDNGVKKSLKGLIRVDSDYGVFDQQTKLQEQTGLLKTVFNDGGVILDSFSSIRERLWKNL